MGTPPPDPHGCLEGVVDGGSQNDGAFARQSALESAAASKSKKN